MTTDFSESIFAMGGPVPPHLENNPAFRAILDTWDATVEGDLIPVEEVREFDREIYDAASKLCDMAAALRDDLDAKAATFDDAGLRDLCEMLEGFARRAGDLHDAIGNLPEWEDQH